MRYIYILFLLFTVSCTGNLKLQSFFDKGEFLARVGEEKLYLNDLKPLFYEGISAKDSASIVNDYVNQWVKYTAKVQRSKVLFEQQQKQIEQMLEKYRNNILTDKFNNMYSSVIDTLITDQQIADYYNNNKSNFLLISPIVKAKLIVYPEELRQEKKVVELMLSDKEEDYNDLLDMVKKRGFTFIDFSDWSYFKDVVTASNISIQEKDIDKFLSKNRDIKIAYDDKIYFLVIYDYMQSGDYTPIDMVKTSIKGYILNERKAQQLKNAEDTLYNQMLSAGDIEFGNIFNKNLDQDSIK